VDGVYSRRKNHENLRATGLERLLKKNEQARKLEDQWAKKFNFSSNLYIDQWWKKGGSTKRIFLEGRKGIMTAS